MLWLTWHMWILLLLAFFGGGITGWILHGKSDQAPQPAPPTPLPKPQAAAAAAPVAPASPVYDQPNAEPATAASDEPEPGPQDETAPEPQNEAAPSVASEGVEDLTTIKGLGPKAAEKLAAEGVTRFAQIASWSEADIDRFDELINGRGRIRRDDWVGQAKALSA